MIAPSTIAALTTGSSPAGIAIIRISGPATKSAIKSLFHSKQNPIDNPRLLTYGKLLDHRSGEIIDHALAVYMPNPHSFTGEDVGEFQFHGSPFLVQKILSSLYSFGISPAEPGEFTKRAFLNGKIDLVQAEAIAEVIGATSEQALKIAGEQLHGRFSKIIQDIADPLRDSLAELEASIDFSDEDITPKSISKISETLLQAKAKIQSLIETYRFGQIMRKGYRVLLCGPPNAGKSSLLNLLLGKERAIVTEMPGTTRDLIEEETLIENFRFVFCDSAGIRDTTNTVETKGIELAKDRIPWADLVLLIADATDQSKQWQALTKYLKGQAKKVWMVTNKIDLNPKAIGTVFCDSSICEQNFYLSVKTRAGLEALLSSLLDEVSNSKPIESETNLIAINERHKNCLDKAMKRIDSAIKYSINMGPIEIISEDLRISLAALEDLVGKTYTEDILGRIFSRFCIGK